VARMTPMLALNASPDSRVGTSIGSRLPPDALLARGRRAEVHARWTAPTGRRCRSVAIDDVMTWDKALAPRRRHGPEKLIIRRCSIADCHLRAKPEGSLQDSPKHNPSPDILADR
jgi:hypothetical protein